MSRITTLAAAALLATAVTASAAVTPFMDVNFDSDTAGSTPAAGPSSNPISKPGALGGYTATTENNPPTAANGSILVNNAGTMSKAAVLTTNSANNELGALYVDTGFSQVSQHLSLSFDFSVLDAPTSGTVQPKTLNGSGSVGILFGINVFGTAQGMRFAAAPTSASGGVFAIRSASNTDLQSFFNYNEGQTYHITLAADYSTGKVTTFVDGTPTGSLTFAAPASGVTTQEIFMHLNGESGNANSVAIDNIVAAVPEPASLSVLGLGSLAMLGRRRRSAH
ncbi:MAG TPA: PEP-CTERM sorting domain-containing protein [Tepidisphaeraceae bacterium]|jgi:hypothetical protein